VARIRTIKPEFFTSGDIVSLTPLARLFYVSMWCEADREGRLEWKPQTFKFRYLPGDSVEVSDLACELQKVGLLFIYEVDGKQYAEIPTFAKHQVINNREAASTLPARVSTREPRVKVASPRAKAEGRKEGREPRVNALRFGEFWESWPPNDRKQDRKACEAKWAAQKLDEAADAILADVAVKKASRKWQEGFIEAPEVYINNRRWEDNAGEPVAEKGSWV
jgi:hypothetical protein